jgi:hypothetical protein
MYAQIMVKVGHFRPAVMAMVLRLEGSQADMGACRFKALFCFADLVGSRRQTTQ